MIFLSYAEEDTMAARTVRDAFRSKGLAVYDWRESVGKLIFSDIEEKLLGAAMFVAILSPSYLASTWCRLERDLAMDLEMDSDRGGSNQFIRVVKVRDVPRRVVGFLRAYGWVDLSDRLLLADSIAAELGVTHERPILPIVATYQSSFRARNDEMARVGNGIANPTGPHLWLVVAPPQLGKTWLMDRVGSQFGGGENAWTVALVDLREYPREELRDPGRLLGRLLGGTEPIGDGHAALTAAAQAIVWRQKSHLCMLDSAELLDPGTTATLRSRLITIHKYVGDGGNLDVRLALVVGSRRADEWVGVDRHGRLETIQLDGFPMSVVNDALRQLMREMGSSFEAGTVQAQAVWIQRQTEGLPALLVRCLQWIRYNGFVPLDRLDQVDLFSEVASPYVRDRLLSEGSLFPGRDGSLAGPQRILAEAFRVLSPYRLFTQSHLRYNLQLDTRFRAAVEAEGWVGEDVQRAIEGTALLLQVSSELWSELHPAIRRVLYRYYYPSRESQVEAHVKAGAFVEAWSDGLVGSDQIVAVAERLWHSAAALRIAQPNKLTEILCRSVESLIEPLRDDLFPMNEVRAVLAKRIDQDRELAALMGEGLDQLVATVRGRN